MGYKMVSVAIYLLLEMVSHHNILRGLRLLSIAVLLAYQFRITFNINLPKIQDNKMPNQKKMCMPMDETVRARRKTCLLRPDTGPCRADILSWYYDARQRKCFRFFWGGCQGNGNKFDSLSACMEYCLLNATMPTMHVPYFCSLTFDFGTCFGHYNRWAWDKLSKTCRRRLYSGCGGNQNNFETRQECLSTCLRKPNNTMDRFQQYTTCIPFTMADLQ